MAAALIGIETNCEIPEGTELELEIKKEEIRIRLNPKLDPEISHSCRAKKIIQKADERKRNIQREKKKKAIEECDTVAGAALVEEIKG